MIQIIGWTILHSLWQIAIIVAFYLIVKTVWKTPTALAKYYLALTAFGSSFLAPIFTFSYLWNQTIIPPMSSVVAPFTKGAIDIPTTVGTTETVVLSPLTWADYLTLSLPYLVTFWGIGVLFYTIRFFINLYGVKQLQNIDNEMITGEWLLKIRTFRQQLNIEKEVQVFLSKHVKEPITFGHFKPVILLPISLITGFDSAAIETILLHELAHIKRHDYLVNLGQSLIEIILFYHPGIWWLSKEIRAFREHCCDDLVLSMGNNRTTYVETLTALQWRKIGAVSNSLSMTASGNEGDFTHRIKRMFGVEEKKGSFRQLMGVFLLLLMVAVGSVFYQNYFPSFAENDAKAGSSIQLLSAKEATIKITEKTTKAEMDRWAKMVNEKGIQFDFKESIFDRKGKVVEVRGNFQYPNSKRGGNFFAKDLPCVHVTFNLYQDQVSNAIFSYPCKEKREAEKIQKESAQAEVFWVNKDLLDNSINELTRITEDKKIFFGYSFNPDTYAFNGSYFVAEGKTEWVEVEDIRETPIKFIIENGFVKSLEVIKRRDKQLSSLTISNKISISDLFQKMGDFQKTANLKVVINDITENDKDNKITGEIRGTIRPNKSGRFHFFEVHDLEKYSILLQGNADTILPPKYIVNETAAVIGKSQNNSAKSSKIKINHQTTRSDLANWANLITRHGIIFNYEKSVFDENNQLIGLNGKFNGQCCFNDAFYISKLDEVEVHLEVKDNYIYQPTVITQTEDGYEELGEKFWSDAMENAGLNAANYDDLWVKGAMRNMKILSNGADKSYEYIGWSGHESEIDSLLENPQTPSSLIPLLKQQQDFKKYVDSVKNSSIGQREATLKLDAKTGLLSNGNTRNGLANLKGVDPKYYPTSPNAIPQATFVKGHLVVGTEHPLVNSSPAMEVLGRRDSIKNLIYRGKVPTDIFAAGQLTYEKDLPSFLKSNKNTIQFDPPKFKRFPKSKADENWIYWEDKRFKLMPKDRKGKFPFAIPHLKVTKEEWEHLSNQPFTFQIQREWFKIKNIANIVLVQKRKAPFPVAYKKGYNRVPFEYNEQSIKLFERVNKVGDHIYYEQIDIGKDYTFGLIVEIIENPVDKSTGFLPKEDIDFKDADLFPSKDFIDASQNTTNNWRKLKESPPSILPDFDQPQSGFSVFGKQETTPNLLLKGDDSIVFYVDGRKWSKESTYKLNPEAIEKIDVLKGAKAQLIYGEEKVVLITTKAQSKR